MSEKSIQILDANGIVAAPKDMAVVPLDLAKQVVYDLFADRNALEAEVAHLKDKVARLMPLAEYGISAYTNVRLIFLDDPNNVHDRMKELRGSENLTTPTK